MALTCCDKEVSFFKKKKKKKNLADATADKLHNVCASKHDSGGRGGLKWWGEGEDSAGNSCRLHFLSMSLAVPISA